MRDERIQEVSEKGGLEERLHNLEQSIKNKRETERRLQSELDHLKNTLSKFVRSCSNSRFEFWWVVNIKTSF